MASMISLASTMTLGASSSSSSSASIENPCKKVFCGFRQLPTLSLPCISQKVPRSSHKTVCAVGDVSPEGTTYLIAGAVAVAVLGTAYPLLFSRKDLCPECDGAGFVRKSGSALAANAARKDLEQIVCPRCKGLGKLGQTDK